jgi:hypothetical protein
MLAGSAAAPPVSPSIELVLFSFLSFGSGFRALFLPPLPSDSLELLIERSSHQSFTRCPTYPQIAEHV